MAYKNTSTVRLKLPESSTLPPVAARRAQPETPQPTLEVGEGLFREFLEGVYDAVIITELNGRILRTNGRAQALFDYSDFEFFQLSITDVISGADAELLTTIREILHDERYVQIEEGYCLRKDGSFFPAEMAINPLHISAEGELCFFVRNISWKKESAEQLRSAQQQLLETAHSAGMAEIATGVLHDVGNVLNSVNVSCEMILSELDRSAAGMLSKANALLEQNKENLTEFLTTDPKGKRLPEVYVQIGKTLEAEREKIQQEATSLRNNVAAIKEVISTQQRYAKADLFIEEFELKQLVEDALSIQTSNAQVLRVEKNYGDTPPVRAQRTKLVMIIMNLVANARDATSGNAEDDRRLVIDTGIADNQVYVRVTDNGEGIPPENLNKIFNHGFTTKADGHGFGLHTSANLMTEMGGKLQVESDGAGMGATFSVTFPV
jgi:PAS domain S-box-containing protein